MRVFSQHTDSELVLLLQNDQASAFDEIYTRYWKKIYNEAFRRLSNQQQCEDIVQDVFVDLWKKRSRREIDELLPYLLSSVKYQVFALYRRNKTLPHFEEPLEHLGVSADDADAGCFEEELISVINQWLETQPESRRNIFRMRYLEGMETKEIADVMNISQKTVQNQLITAKASFRLTVFKHFLLMVALFYNQNLS